MYRAVVCYKNTDGKIENITVTDGNDTQVILYAEAKILLKMNYSVKGLTLDNGELVIDPSIPLFDESKGTMVNSNGDVLDDLTGADEDEEDDEYAIDEDDEWEEEDEEDFVEEVEERSEYAVELHKSDGSLDHQIDVFQTDEEAVAYINQNPRTDAEANLHYTIVRIDYEDDAEVDTEVIYDESLEDDEVEEYDDDYEEVEEDDEYDDEEYIDDDDDEESEENEVSKLYKILTPEQKKILQMYYMWYSRRLFVDMGKTEEEFELKVKKNRDYSKIESTVIKKKLMAMDKYRDDPNAHWVYAGCIDLGCVVNAEPEQRDYYRTLSKEEADEMRYHYACSFGHNVRYIQVIWNAAKGNLDDIFFNTLWADYRDLSFTSITEHPNAIKSGINCLKDFFDLTDVQNKVLVSRFKSIMATTLEDIKILYGIYTMGQQNPKFLQDIKDSLSLMRDYIKQTELVVKLAEMRSNIKGEQLDSFYSNYNSAVTKMFTDMLDSGMIPPYSIVLVVRDILSGWYQHNANSEIELDMHSYNRKEFNNKFKVLSTYAPTVRYLELKHAKQSNPDIQDDARRLPYLFKSSNVLFDEHLKDASRNIKGKYDIENFKGGEHRYREDISPIFLIDKYLDYALCYGICGFYKNNITTVYAFDEIRTALQTYKNGLNKKSTGFRSRDTVSKLRNILRREGLKDPSDRYSITEQDVKSAEALLAQREKDNNFRFTLEGGSCKSGTGTSSLSQDVYALYKSLEFGIETTRTLEEGIEKAMFVLDKILMMFADIPNTFKVYKYKVHQINYKDHMIDKYDIEDDTANFFTGKNLSVDPYWMVDALDYLSTEGRDDTTIATMVTLIYWLMGNQYAGSFGRYADKGILKYNKFVSDGESDFLDKIDYTVEQYYNLKDEFTQKLEEYAVAKADAKNKSEQERVDNRIEYEARLSEMEKQREAAEEAKRQAKKIADEARKQAEAQAEADRQAKQAKLDAYIASGRTQFFSNLVLAQANTVDDDTILDDLKQKDLTQVTDASQQTNISIFNSWLNSGYDHPTPNMMRRIRQLYEFLNPTQNGVTSVDVDTLPDLKSALQWAIANGNLEKKTKDICESIISRKSISYKQSKYALEAYAVFKVHEEEEQNG